MALAARGLGARIDIPTAALAHAWCFGEDQGRYVVATADPGRVLAAAAAAGVAACTVGAVTADANLTLAADDLVSVEALRHRRSEEHTSELQSPMRISYAAVCLKKKT